VTILVLAIKRTKLLSCGQAARFSLLFVTFGLPLSVSVQRPLGVLIVVFVAIALLFVEFPRNTTFLAQFLLLLSLLLASGLCKVRSTGLLSTSNPSTAQGCEGPVCVGHTASHSYRSGCELH
jgi:hypothetical protein